MPWSDTARIVDVSHYQAPDDLDWKTAAAAGVVGLVCKYTQGVTGVDPAAVEHAWNAYRAGLMLGGYHFGDGSDPEAQAAHFLDAMRADYGSDLTARMVMLDAEQNRASQMSVRDAEIFVSAIHDAIGRWPFLYTGKFGPAGNGEGLPSAILLNCPLFLPKYGPSPTAASLPAGFRMPSDVMARAGVLRLHQFSDGTINGGPVAGLGRVDQSRFVGVTSLAEAQALWAS